MTLDEIRKRADGEQDSLWWSYRLLDHVCGLEDNANEDLQAAAVDAFLRLATADVEWATAAVTAGGPAGHRLARFFSGERLAATLSRLRLPSTSEEALLAARMLAGSAAWQKGESAEALYRRAWEQLQRVPEPDRDAAWKGVALTPAAYADYPQYRARATEHLTTLVDQFWRSHFLAKAIPVAARHRDWPTFESWLGERRALPEPLRRDHDECAIINLEGLRALDEGRIVEAEAAMQRLLELAPGQQFISNDDTSALPKRLRADGIAITACDAFDALVTRQDWRRLRK